MAFRSAQGPQLGLPQMIQSRPQFGYIGALLVWLSAYVQYETRVAEAEAAELEEGAQRHV